MSSSEIILPLLSTHFQTSTVNMSRESATSTGERGATAVSMRTGTCQTIIIPPPRSLIGTLGSRASKRSRHANWPLNDATTAALSSHFQNRQRRSQKSSNPTERQRTYTPSALEGSTGDIETERQKSLYQLEHGNPSFLSMSASPRKNRWNPAAGGTAF